MADLKQTWHYVFILQAKYK